MTSGDLGPSTATVLFTDLLGSTEARARLGEEAADELRRRHDRLLAAAVETNRGRVVKGLGDGLMATFAGAADALGAAVAIQRALDRHNRAAGDARRLDVRIGLSAGDVSFEEGDCFGTPVVEAARLCAAAGAGHILAAQVVRILAGSRGGHRFVPFGALELKGLPEPVSAVEVTWAPDAGSVVPLPVGLDRPGFFRFVGRAGESEGLGRAWKEAVGGERRVVRWGASRGSVRPGWWPSWPGVSTTGAVVLYGRCEEELGVPYQPFAEALGAYATACPPEELADQVGLLGGELVRLVPSLPARLPGLPEPLRAEPETERYRLFEAVREFVAGISGRAPVLLVLDDLHWAAKPTLVLLGHLVRSAESVRLLVAGTYRDTDLTRTHPLAEMLADLRREPGVERLALGGLDEAEVAAFLEAAAGHELDAEAASLARAIHAETEGNPFFVGEVLRHLAESGAVAQRDGRWATQRPLAELGIPEGVREVVGRRLSRLSPAANEILAVAAAVGREFDLALLTEAAEAGTEGVLDALERAEEARLVAVVAGHPERYAFAHALVRSTLYDELPTSRRLRLHRRIGHALEARPDAEARTAELARHFCEAAALGEAARAVAYARQAGDQARAGLAFEEAAAHYERGLGALELAEAPDLELRCDLEIALGDCLHRTGDGRHREVLTAAADSARGLGDFGRLAEVALSLNPVGLWSALGKVDEEFVALAEEALAGLGQEESALRARLLAALAVERSWQPDLERRAALAREAVAVARRVADHRQLARVLVAHHRAAHSPDNFDERLAVSAEAVTLAGELDDPEAGFWAYMWRYVDLFEAGDPGWAPALETCGHQADRLRQPYFAWLIGVLRGMGALATGRLDDAERLALAARRVGRERGSRSLLSRGSTTASSTSSGTSRAAWRRWSRPSPRWSSPSPPSRSGGRAWPFSIARRGHRRRPGRISTS